MLGHSSPLGLIMPLRFMQLDVFCTRAGGGNPLAVVLGADHWPEPAFQAFATWTNLVETTFLLPPTDQSASYRLRIFTPQREIPFAGHPTVGSAHAALECAWVQAVDGLLIQECGAGLLPIRVNGSGHDRRIFVQAPPATVVLRGDAAVSQVAPILAGLDLGNLGVALVAGGRRWWLAELASEALLRAWTPDHPAIGDLARASDSLGLCAFARSDSPDYQLVVRAFPAGVGIVEDPASGAANALIAAYIAQSEPESALARGYRVSQGREMGKDAVIDVEIDEAGQAWVGGQTQTVIDGQLRWPVNGH